MDTPAIKVKAVKSHLPLPGGRDPGYMFSVIPGKKLTNEEFVALFANRLGVSDEKAVLCIKALQGVLTEQLAYGRPISIGWLQGKLVVTGSGDALNDQPDKTNNPVKAKIWFGDTIQKALAMMDVENVTVAPEASLLELVQAGLVEQNRITAADTLIVATGRGLKLDTNNADEYVALYKGDILVERCSIVYCDAATVQFKLATLPESGEYQIRIATRNGEDPAEYAPALLKRNVMVVNE
ncbi:MAG: hypothetical protein J5912_09550 [Clostridia bacterium]|nr:hypothetical protein [Clostridia bacterium]